MNSFERKQNKNDRRVFANCGSEKQTGENDGNFYIHSSYSVFFYSYLPLPKAMQNLRLKN
jgi:hypothetical protein